MPINREEILFTDFTAPQKAQIIADTVTRFTAKRIKLLNIDDSTDGVIETAPTLISILEINALPRDTDGEFILPAKVYPIKAPYLS